MALNQSYYNLKNLRCTLKNGQSGLISLRIKRNPKYDPKWPGQAPVPSQTFQGEDFPEIIATVYNDDNMNFASVVPNEPIESFTLLSPNDADESFLGDLLTKFPASGMVFGGPETTLEGDKNSQLTIPIMCNVLNQGADGGFPA